MDVESNGRLIEVKAFGKTARGDGLWLESNQVRAALDLEDFHLYIVDNVRQGDPQQFGLVDLYGDVLAQLLSRRKEHRYFTVPFPVHLYDEHRTSALTTVSRIPGRPSGLDAPADATQPVPLTSAGLPRSSEC